MTLMSEALQQVRSYKKEEQQLDEGTKLNDKNIRLFATRLADAADEAADRAIQTYINSFAQENNIDDKAIEKFKDDLYVKTRENMIKYVKSYRW